MAGKQRGIHAQEFGCQAPLRFYERCTACPRYGEHCADLLLGKELLQGRKKLVYTEDGDQPKETIFAGQFTCSAPLRYYEATRDSCGHGGRCREEGLLISLLCGRKGLDYRQKEVTTLPHKDRHRSETAPSRVSAKTMR